ncbi:hypothetical protein D3C78_1220040 [compost metagenome]
MLTSISTSLPSRASATPVTLPTIILRNSKGLPTLMPLTDGLLRVSANPMGPLWLRGKRSLPAPWPGLASTKDPLIRVSRWATPPSPSLACTRVNLAPDCRKRAAYCSSSSALKLT